MGNAGSVTKVADYPVATAEAARSRFRSQGLTVLQQRIGSFELDFPSKMRVSDYQN